MIENLLIKCPTNEAETVIVYVRNEDKAVITTTDNTVWTKLRRCIQANPQEWRLDEVNRSKSDGSVSEICVSCPKRYISLRTGTAHKARKPQ